MFSSKNFIVSSLMSRSLIHFEFIFVCGIRECSYLVDLHVAVQFSSHTVHGVLKARILGLPFPSPVDLILSDLSTMTLPSWVALHGIAWLH